MIKDRKILEKRGIEVDLQGSQGNAFVLLGLARNLGEQLGMSQEEIETVTREMKSGNYENLVSVFENYFSDYVTIYR